MDHAGLERMLSTTNWWTNLWLVVGAIGVFGEYVLRFLSEKRNRESKVKKTVSLLFAAMVLCGVFGGYIFGRRLSKESGITQSRAEAEMAHAKQEVQQARSEAARSLNEALSTQERISKNEKEAARLRKVAEKERLAALELKRQLAPRRLSSNIQIKLAGKLLPYRGQRATVVYRAGDLEASAFAGDLTRALIRVGWVSSGPIESSTIISLTGEALEINRRQGV